MTNLDAVTLDDTLAQAIAPPASRRTRKASKPSLFRRLPNGSFVVIVVQAAAGIGVSGPDICSAGQNGGGRSSVILDRAWFDRVLSCWPVTWAVRFFITLPHRIFLPGSALSGLPTTGDGPPERCPAPKYPGRRYGCLLEGEGSLSVNDSQRPAFSTEPAPILLWKTRP
jgi:hypothetical protein